LHAARDRFTAWYAHRDMKEEICNHFRDAGHTKSCALPCESLPIYLIPLIVLFGTETVVDGFRLNTES
jgi:hypothetical protein